MTRRTFLIVTLVVVLTLIAVARSRENRCRTHHHTYAVQDVRVEDRTHRLLVADTPDLWSYGLMNIRSRADICGYDGMLFRFPVAIPQTFWNKDTLIDLDVYWMRRGEVVGKSHLPAIAGSDTTTIRSPEPADMVVEYVSD